MTTAALVDVIFGGDTAGFDSAYNRIQQGLGQLGSGLMAATAPLVAFGGYSLKAAIEFESAFAGVMKTIDATDEQYAALRDTILDMSTDATNPLAGLENSAVEIAKIMEVAGQLGVPLESLQEFTQVMGELGLSTNLTSEEAAMMAARFANITGMDFGDIRRFGSTVVDLGNNLATSESEIMQFAMRLAGIGNTIGLSEDQILGLSGAMSSVGLNAEAGGTAMTSIFSKMIEATGEGGAALDTWASVANMSATDFANVWSNEPILALTAFLDGFNKLSQGDQVAILDELELSGIRVSDTIRRLSGNVPLLVDALSIASEAWAQNTALQDEATKRFETTEAQMNLAKNQMKGLGIVVGSILLPALNDILTDLSPIVTGFAEWADENPELIMTVAQVTAAVFGLGLALKGASIVLGIGGTLATGVISLTTGLARMGVMILTTAFPGLTSLAASALSAAANLPGVSAALGLLNPLLLVGAVFAAAYATNFGGFRDKVNETGEAIRNGNVAGAILGVANSMLAIPLGLATEFGDLIGVDVPGGLAAWGPAFDNLKAIVSALAGKISEAAKGLADLIGLGNQQTFSYTDASGTTTTGMHGFSNFSLDNVTGGVENVIRGGDGTRIDNSQWDIDWMSRSGAQRNATGGMVGGGEWSWVGENGPELVRFPQSGRVYSNPQSMRMGGGGFTNYGEIHVHGVQNVRDLLEQLEAEAAARGA